MPIDYTRRSPRQVPVTTTPRVASSQARTQLRYWIDQYQRLTGEIQAAQVTNADQWRKEKTDTRKLYSLRAAAAGQMATWGEAVLGEL